MGYWGTEQLYVFGWTWWPFDGAVTAGLLALCGTAGLLGFNAWSFDAAEKRNQRRHTEALQSVEKTSARDHALARFREALDSIDTGLDRRVEFGIALLQSLAGSEWLSREDRVLAVHTLAAYNRPRSRTMGGGGEQ